MWRTHVPDEKPHNYKVHWALQHQKFVLGLLLQHGKGGNTWCDGTCSLALKTLVIVLCIYFKVFHEREVLLILIWPIVAYPGCLLYCYII